LDFATFSQEIRAQYDLQAMSRYFDDGTWGDQAMAFEAGW
jgi:hypothetical protein